MYILLTFDADLANLNKSKVCDIVKISSKTLMETFEILGSFSQKKIEIFEFQETFHLLYIYFH